MEVGRYDLKHLGTQYKPRSEMGTTDRNGGYYGVESRAARYCVLRPGDTSRRAEQILAFKREGLLSVRRESKP